MLTESGEAIEFDSYLIPESDLEIGQLRLLDVDQRLVVPVDTHVRYIVTGADVIHNFAVPSLGIKVDCTPGRLNQVSALIEREGVFYGRTLAETLVNLRLQIIKLRESPKEILTK
jgi:cytochrome c oxidase subunit 2